jgi:hypothetical protein
VGFDFTEFDGATGPTARTLIDPGPSPRGWHRLETFLQCPQRYAFKYVAGATGTDGLDAPTPATAYPLALGSLAHVGLAHHYTRMQARQRGRDPDAWHEPLDAVRELARRKSLVEPGNGTVWDDALGKALTVTRNYIEHYAGRDDFTVLSVEDVWEIRYPLPVPIRKGETDVLLTARVDLVQQDRAGKVWFTDHKTSAKITSDHARFYGISGQLINYRHIGRAVFGERFGGVMVNLVQTAFPGFSRVVLDPAPALSEKFPRIVADAETGIARMEAEGRAVADWPAAASELVCWHRYGPCAHIDRCKWGVR